MIKSGQNTRIVKSNKGLTDSEKVKMLMKHLSMTPDEFYNEFEVLRSTMISLLNGTGSLSNKSKLLIVKLYPEISKNWIENGTGQMLSGLYPNIKLSRLLESVYNLDLESIINKDLLCYSSIILKIDYMSLLDIVNNIRQIRYIEYKRLSSSLEVDKSKLASEDLDSLSIPSYIRARFMRYKLLSESGFKDTCDKIKSSIKMDNLSRFNSNVFNYMYKVIPKSEFYNLSNMAYRIGISRESLVRLFSGGSKIEAKTIDKICFRYPEVDRHEFLCNISIYYRRGSELLDGGMIYESIKEFIKDENLYNIGIKVGEVPSDLKKMLTINKSISFSLIIRLCKEFNIPYNVLKKFKMDNDINENIDYDTINFDILIEIIRRREHLRMLSFMISDDNPLKELISEEYPEYEFINNKCIKYKGDIYSSFMDKDSIINIKRNKDIVMRIPENIMIRKCLWKDIVVFMYNEKIQKETVQKARTP